MCDWLCNIHIPHFCGVHFGLNPHPWLYPLSALSHCPIFSSHPSPLPPLSLSSLLSLWLPVSEWWSSSGWTDAVAVIYLSTLTGFIQIIHRPCTLQTLRLNGLHWQLSQPYPQSDTQIIPKTVCKGWLGRLHTQADKVNHSNTLMAQDRKGIRNGCTISSTHWG